MKLSTNKINKIQHIIDTIDKHTTKVYENPNINETLDEIHGLLMDLRKELGLEKGA